ncbi:unnamed protein product [Phytophthora fragariaefolia]|uniref:Unnamed protein product n=1 Tax=Phytophthora fragariaefolia TaxID=1490495 RepID=A0A9W6XCU8_9STRA|nr:unnamed protein product [Phytophthora fragariaefolia]
MVVHGAIETWTNQEASTSVARTLRVEKKIEEFVYELELPGKSGYWFYPVVHVSRLKAVKELGERPTTRLIHELGQAERLEFDEQLLPEDSWEPDEDEDKYEVEAILDDGLLLSTSTASAQRMFNVKWLAVTSRVGNPVEFVMWRFVVRLLTEQEAGEAPANGAGGR